MTASPSSLGALYISVSLDTTRARRQLQDFQNQMRRASATGVTGLGGRGQAATLGQTAVGLNKVAAAANNVGRSSKGLSTFRKELTTTAAILAPGRAGTALYGIGALGRAMSALGPAGAGATAGMVGITGAAIAASAAVIGLGVGLSKLTGIGIEAGRKLETLTVSLNTLMGPAAAKQEIGFLLELAQVSPFLTDTIINMDKMLYAQGLVSTGLRRGLIQSVTDMGAALGLTDDNLDSLTYALSQVQARGYLTGDEARQLANQFVPIWKMLQELPQFAGMTTTQLRKLSEEGKISAQTLFEAFQTYSERFAGAAELQANTLTGLILRFQDFKNAIGLAFLDVEARTTGPIEVLRNVLRTLNDQISRVDWRPIAAAIGNLMNTAIGPLTNMLNRSGGAISTFFEEVLPRVVGAIQGLVRMFRAMWIGFGDAIGQFFIIAKPILIAFGVAALGVFAGILIGINAVINAFGFLMAMIRLVMNTVNAMFALLAGDNEAFITSWNASMDSLSDSAQSFINGIEGSFGVLEGAADVINGLAGGTVPKFASVVGDTTEPVDDLNDSLGETEEAGKGAAAGIDEARRAMGELFDLLKRGLFGEPSDLEKGLFGEGAFDATIDSIRAMGTTLIEALRVLGASETIRLVRDSTLALLELAQQRDLVAEKLEEAESHLANAIQARDEFARRIREQSIAFANALETESEAVTRFRSFTRDGVLFFIEEETTKQKSFVETLKERVVALKDFLRNIKILAARGLDKGLLETIFAAGPEQGGAIAAGLAAGGQAMIGEVNALQGQLGNVADQLSDFGSEAFYQAGVDQAQAIVDGLNADMDAIEEQALAITNVVYAAIAPWAKEFFATAKGAAGAGGAGFTAGIPAIDTGMAGINAAIEQPTTEWDAFMQHGASTANTAINTGVTGWLAEIDRWMEETEAKLKEPFENFQDWLEDFKIDIKDANINFWNIPAEFFTAVAEMLARAQPFSWMFPGLPQTISGLQLTAIAAANYFWGKYNSARANPAPGHPHGGHPDQSSTQSTQATTQMSLAGTTSTAVPQVNVFIGEEPLTTMIQTELVVQDASQTSHIVRGRRA